MMWKWIGAMLVIAGCGTVGFSMARAHRREERLLRSFKGALDFMACELQYRLTPLPELCRLAGKAQKNPVGQTFLRLSRELNSQMMPDVKYCMNNSLRDSDLPKRLVEGFELLGQNLGRFDIQGQLKGMEMVRDFCDRELDSLSMHREERLRSYQTLGICAGAALAILFV